MHFDEKENRWIIEFKLLKMNYQLKYLSAALMILKDCRNVLDVGIEVDFNEIKM
jgi:hypothetical protein